MSKVKEYLWLETDNDIELYYPPEATMHISKMIPSKFIKGEDVDPPILVTIRDVREKNVAKDGEPAENKWSLSFSDYEKPLVLNVTNIQLCVIACGSENTEDWIGRQIVLYYDPTITFAGKITGGVRIRPSKLQSNNPHQAHPTPNAGSEFNDDIGF